MMRLTTGTLLGFALLFSSPALADGMTSAPLSSTDKLLCNAMNPLDIPVTGRLQLVDDAGTVALQSPIVVLQPGQVLSLEQITPQRRYCRETFDDFVRADLVAMSFAGVPLATSLLTPDLSPLGFMSVNRDELNGLAPPHLLIEGANVHVRSGLGQTGDPITGLGNFIVGYNEPPDGGLAAGDRSGAHNLVVGIGHKFPSFGGLVAGAGNTISGAFASVLGGFGNTASGPFATVSGGGSNTASGQGASISGGAQNTASGVFSSVGGGTGFNITADLGWATQDLIDALRAELLGIITQVAADLQAAIQALTDVLVNFIQNDFVNAINDLTNAIITGDQAVIAAFQAADQALATALGNAIAAGDTAVLTALQDAVTQLATAIGNGDTAVLNALTNAVNSLSAVDAALLDAINQILAAL